MIQIKNSSLGQKYGRLLILGQWLKQVKTQKQSWVRAQCDCGKLKEYDLASLKRGRTKSCGCLRKEFKGHRVSKTSIYRAWANIIQRCTNFKNTNFKHYGARGIQAKTWATDLKV